MTTLRSKLIRLAHERPEVRSHLLPLLKVRVASPGNPYALLDSAEPRREATRDLSMAIDMAVGNLRTCKSAPAIQTVADTFRTLVNPVVDVYAGGGVGAGDTESYGAIVSDYLGSVNKVYGTTYTLKDLDTHLDGPNGATPSAFRLGSPSNPYSLYPGHEKVTKEISDEIDSVSEAVKASYKRLNATVDKNGALGTRDSDSLGGIWDDWRDAIKKAMRG